MKKINGADGPLSQVPFAYWASNTHFWLYLAIGSGIFFVIFLLITIGIGFDILSTSTHTGSAMKYDTHPNEIKAQVGIIFRSKPGNTTE